MPAPALVVGPGITVGPGVVVEGLLAIPPGQPAYTTAGTYIWTAPAGVTSVSVVAIGGGAAGGVRGGAGSRIPGGTGGGLGWKNNIPITPGATYTVVVGEGQALEWFDEENPVSWS